MSIFDSATDGWRQEHVLIYIMANGASAPLLALGVVAGGAGSTAAASRAGLAPGAAAAATEVHSFSGGGWGIHEPFHLVAGGGVRQVST